MDEFIKHIVEEWQLVIAAPVISLMALTVVCGAIWVAMQWRYGGTIDNLKETVDHYEKKAKLNDPTKTTDSETEPKDADVKSECFARIYISTDAPEIALLHAKAKINADFVKVFLDYSSFHRSLSSAKWKTKQRITLARFDQVEKEIDYEISLVSGVTDVDGKTTQLKWGISLDDKNIISAEKNRASVVFVTPKGEQQFNFLLIQKKTNGEISVVILDEKDISFSE